MGTMGLWGLTCLLWPLYQEPPRGDGEEEEQYEEGTGTEFYMSRNLPSLRRENRRKGGKEEKGGGERERERYREREIYRERETGG